MKKSKTIEQTFKKLTEIEHVLKRTGRYLGTIRSSPTRTFVINDGAVTWQDVSYSPVLLKIFDEIISNSADFSKTEHGKHLNRIEVDIDRSTGTISVFDNGGIPVVKHAEYDQYIPDMIFSELRTGSNFDDDADSISTGQNGEGATLTNIFSTKFTVDTADGKNRFLCVYTDNLSSRTVPDITKTKKAYTKITFTPDYNRIGVDLDDDHYLMLVRRVYEIAATNPHLNVFVNGTNLKFKSFKDFCAMFSDKRIDFGHDRFQVSLFHSKDGFQQIGFINSTNVVQGGTHVDYVMNQIVAGVREYVKKKTKQDIKPSDIKNHFFLMVNATINNPRYNSQTKEKLETAPREYGTVLDIDDKTIQKIIKSDIVAEIIEWAINKQKLEELAELKKKNKSLSKSNSLRDISKYEPATSKARGNCMLFVAEGDSARLPLQSARNPEYHGLFALKGKPINARNSSLGDMLANKELVALMEIIGLQFGVEPSLTDLRYSKLVITTDQDLDGFHLCGLVINMFYYLWPGLVKKGFLYKLETPIVRVTQGKNEIDFMSIAEFDAWKAKQTKSYNAHYLKGIGSNDTKYLKQYMFEDKYMVPIVYKDGEDDRALDIAFDTGKADERKEYIYGISNAN
jgi:Type IIA topoisomerase (DNA gyrase/topo II, topoisomerase IV), B subunit